MCLNYLSFKHAPLEWAMILKSKGRAKNKKEFQKILLQIRFLTPIENRSIIFNIIKDVKVFSKALTSQLTTFRVTLSIYKVLAKKSGIGCSIITFMLINSSYYRTFAFVT
jgi:hypothetical protein